MTIQLIDSPPFFTNIKPPPQPSYLHRLSSFLHNKIDKFSPSSMNLKHLAITNLSINLTEVPDSIQIDKLIDMFQEINFDKPYEPGYMPPSTRKEDDFTYTKEQLLLSLNQFITSLHKKTAFNGTPAANTSHLQYFFMHIENIVRFSIYKVNKSYNDFMQTLGGIPPEPQDPSYKIFEDQLQAKARLVIDLALTGGHCGARLMGTSIELYQMLKDEKTKECALQESLLTILANLREHIANKQIARLVNALDSNLQKEHTAHVTASYMAKLGPLLGLPGTLHYRETSHIVQINKCQILRDFFRNYTPTLIREKIKTEIQASQNLREVIMNWIKEQAGAWKQEEYNAQAEELWQKIVTTEEAPPSSRIDINLWERLIKHLETKLTQFPSMANSWQNFIIEVMHLKESKEFFKEQNLDVYARMRLQKDISSLNIKKQTLPEPSELEQKSLLLTKASHINHIIHSKGFLSLEEDSLLRGLSGEANLKELLKDHVDRARQSEFLTAIQPFILNPNETDCLMDQTPTLKLREEVLNWVLSSSEIIYT